MGRMKLGVALAGAVVVLLGVVAILTMRSDGGSDRAIKVATDKTETTVSPLASYVSPTVPPITTPVPTTAARAKQSSGTTPTTAAPAKSAPVSGGPASSVPQPSVQDIQKLIAGITAQIQASPATGTTAPLTAEQVEAQVREQLRQIGITY